MNLTNRSILRASALALALAAPAAARHAGDMEVGSTADGGGPLTVVYDFDSLIPVQYDAILSGLLGLSAYTATDPGFDVPPADEPDESLYVLDPGTTVTVEVTAIDPGTVVAVLNGQVLDSVGDTAVLGTQGAPPACRSTTIPSCACCSPSRRTRLRRDASRSA